MEPTVFALLALVLLRILTPSTSQDCSLPDSIVINTNLRSLLISNAGEGGTLVTTLLDHHFTCLAVGSSRDQYRQVSVAVRYTKNTASEQFTAQFPLRCTSGIMNTVGELDQSPPANVFNISSRRDCFVCTTLNSHPDFTINTVADCACKCIILHITDMFLKTNTLQIQYVAAPVWWRVKVAVWLPQLTVVHSTTLMAPAPHLVLQTMLPHLAVDSPVVSCHEYY